MNADEYRLTGRQVLIWLLAFFGIIFAVNGALVWFALSLDEQDISRTSLIRLTSSPVVAMLASETEHPAWPS